MTTLITDDWSVTACFTGHRPQKLGGFNWKNPIMLQLKEHLLRCIERLINEEGITRFITGGALGTDQAAFWCVEIMKKKYPHLQNIVAIPFEDESIKWSKDQQVLYMKMLKRANQVIDVSLLDKYDSKEAPQLPIRSFSKKKMDKRNYYMVDHSRIVVAVYDGSSSGTKNCFDYAVKHKRLIWRYNPADQFRLNILPHTA